MDEKKMQEIVKRHNETIIIELRSVNTKQRLEIDRLKKLLMEMIEENAELNAKIYLMEREKEAGGDDGIEMD